MVFIQIPCQNEHTAAHCNKQKLFRKDVHKTEGSSQSNNIQALAIVSVTVKTVTLMFPMHMAS